MATITLKTVLLPLATLRAVQAVLAHHGVEVEVHEEPTRQASFCVLILPAGSRRERDGYVCGHEQNYFYRMASCSARLSTPRDGVAFAFSAPRCLNRRRALPSFSLFFLSFIFFCRPFVHTLVCIYVASLT